MRISKFSCFGLALSGLLLLGAEAQAVPISYTTFGSFVGGTGPQNDDTFVSDNGLVTIQYLPAETTSYDVDFGESTIADFGSFMVTTAGPTNSEIVAGFTLTVLQVQPTLGTADFPATLSGTLRIGASGASVFFTELTEVIDPVVYTIIENDGGIPGRAALVPPTLNEQGQIIPGVTSIEARLTVVPEPSAIVLMGLGAIAPVALMIRRRKIQAVA